MFRDRRSNRHRKRQAPAKAGRTGKFGQSLVTVSPRLLGEPTLPGQGESPFPVDFYLSWTSPGFCVEDESDVQLGIASRCVVSDSMTIQIKPKLPSSDAPPSGNATFPATIRAHGEYMPLAYVVRLSPLIHQTLAGLPPTGIFNSSEIGLDGAQAFSTYLHETIHWWQHIGSTYGLMSSLSYPTRSHGNQKPIKELISRGALKKSVFRMASEGSGPSTPETVQGLANIIVNNHFDLSAFSYFPYNTEIAETIASSPMFESLGHFMHVTYGQNLSAMAGVTDSDYATLPDPRTWVKPFQELKQDKVEGFYYGSRVTLWPLGAREIMEGQACFSQIQYLHFASGGKLEWDSFRGLGILHGVYEEAFKQFLGHVELDFPNSINHPTVALFLLVCDMALNPGSGFPFDPFPRFRSFIDDTIPGIRFTKMARTIRRDLPELLGAIKDYTRGEYEAVSDRISAAMRIPSPMQITARCESWARGPMSSLMEEYRTYNYQPTNRAVRVLLSHFLAFSRDKLATPEVFCWPGAWMAGSNLSDRVVDLFDRHGALFVDRETDSGIYPRMRKGYTEKAIQQMFEGFFAAVVVYEMTDQLIVKSGPFEYKYDWLKPSASPEEFKQFADRNFKAAYGIAPDEIEII